MNRHDLNDTRLFWKLSARPGGIHSHDARKLGVSGNPSQRSKDCADRTPMWKIRAPRNGRNGTRYFADGYQPSDATPVKPNHGPQVTSTASELGVLSPPSRNLTRPADSGVVLAWVGDFRPGHYDPEEPFKQVPMRRAA